MEWFKNLKISRKLSFGFGVILLILLSGAVFQVYELNVLGNMQDEGAGHSKNVNSLAAVTDHINQVFSFSADAIINRDLDEISRELPAIKQRMEEDIAIIKKIAVSEDEKKNSC